jgi:hypothetical protein
MSVTSSVALTEERGNNFITCTFHLILMLMKDNEMSGHTGRMGEIKNSFHRRGRLADLSENVQRI